MEDSDAGTEPSGIEVEAAAVVEAAIEVGGSVELAGESDSVIPEVGSGIPSRRPLVRVVNSVTTLPLVDDDSSGTEAKDMTTVVYQVETGITGGRLETSTGPGSGMKLSVGSASSLRAAPP